MEDGFNEARALRIAEIMTEFQSLQRRIAEYSPNHSPDEYFEEGYEVLRQCRAEAQAVLVAPYPVELSDASSISGDSEKRHLQSIIVDASARRFQSKKIYLRAVAAVRWSNARNSILQSGKPLQQQAVLLQQANADLHTVGADLPCVPTVTDGVLSKELAAVTDIRIYNEFQQTDSEAGYWLQEDPPLATILDWMRTYPA
ncbi:MAG: hypothetical protein L6R38_005783 [Xanthoria sp. 2 TBL-2021]|nr:MAG: hypothetical protein L6R38_005783 [Xanthoria sp. 2 TBL-2021]